MRPPMRRDKQQHAQEQNRHEQDCGESQEQSPTPALLRAGLCFPLHSVAIRGICLRLNSPHPDSPISVAKYVKAKRLRAGGST